MNKKLPIGISSFEEIRTSNYYYVDKTHFIKKLVDQGKYYFLSRPRRFGKSLFLDTIRCAFEGRKELFQGLFLEDNWNWSQTFPVIRLSFDEGIIKKPQELLSYIFSYFNQYSRMYEIELHEELFFRRFKELVEKVYLKFNKQVILLVDEYDKPILDNIENLDSAKEIREILKGLYQTIKSLDKYLKFVFITGISKFAKVSLFSGLNQLNDISLDREYSTICGYTENELINTFGHLIDNNQLESIKQWYNGYSWLGENVYNPFDVLLYLQKKDFRNYWFETGTPSFLIKILQQKQYYIPQLERIVSSEELLNAFDIESIEPEALLFQTGYLTIKDTFVKNQRTFFVLSYPNFEVKLSFNSRIASLLVNSTSLEQKFTLQLMDIFDNLELEKLPEFLNNLFTQIPFQWYIHTSQYEAFYCTVFYVFMVATGLNVTAEDISSTGSIDLTVVHQNIAYVFELKVDKGQPIEQILTKQYFNKYLNYEKIFAIGIVVDSSSKSVKHFRIQKIK
ncbi:MAG: AAA family ATPase [bacterium]